MFLFDLHFVNDDDKSLWVTKRISSRFPFLFFSFSNRFCSSRIGRFNGEISGKIDSLLSKRRTSFSFSGQKFLQQNFGRSTLWNSSTGHSFRWKFFVLFEFNRDIGRLESNIRLITLSLTIELLKKLVLNIEENVSYLSDHHLARIEQAREQSTEDLRRHYRVKTLFYSSFHLVQFLATRNVSRHVRRRISSDEIKSGSSRISFERCVYALSGNDDAIERSRIYQTFTVGRHRTSATRKSIDENFSSKFFRFF